HVDGANYRGCVTFPTPCPTTIPEFDHRFTVSGWVKFDRFQTAPYSLGDFAIVQGSSAGTEGSWGVGATDICGMETLGFMVAPSANSAARVIRCGTTVISIGTWYYV